MNWLLQGDVGSGKTAMAATLCRSTIASGVQAAFMVPTEILARQHYETMQHFLEPFRLNVALFTSSVPVVKRCELPSQLKEGSIHLLAGTHAPLNGAVGFRQLGLVVTDEQHRSGIAQCVTLTQKGDHPHILIMSVMPTPRTLALMAYGDLEFSVLDELPSGRQKTGTYVIDSAKRARAFGFIHKKIDAGQQCYIIYPLIEDSESDMASVTQYARGLQEEWSFASTVDVLHGRSCLVERDCVMGEFTAGRTDIPIFATVVETGIDVPNAVVMLIENVERYGPSQLHQLRERIGRGAERSTCILVSDVQNKETRKRLRVMCETTDGFRIADEDLRLRGPGNFFGARQHGLPVLRIADMSVNFALLQLVQGEAKELLVHDLAMKLPEHRDLWAEVHQLFFALE